MLLSPERLVLSSVEGSRGTKGLGCFFAIKKCFDLWQWARLGVRLGVGKKDINVILKGKWLLLFEKEKQQMR